MDATAPTPTPLVSDLQEEPPFGAARSDLSSATPTGESTYSSSAPFAGELELIEALSATDFPPGQRRFKIGEVARIVGVKPFVLRFWEQSFEGLKPEKTEAGHRRYRREDVALFLTIRRLRHEEDHSIERVRTLLAARPRPTPGAGGMALDAGLVHEQLMGLRGELDALLAAARE